MDAARLACGTNLILCDAIDVHRNEVRLLGDRDRVEGSLKHGLLTWRCFRIYLERFRDGALALVMHNDGRAMLVITTMQELTSKVIVNVARSFLFDAAKALDAEALATRMLAGIMP